MLGGNGQNELGVEVGIERIELDATHQIGQRLVVVANAEPYRACTTSAADQWLSTMNERGMWRSRMQG
jgi:hypothetical protein